MPIIFTRERLHCAVWTFPIGELSRKFKITTAKIRAACQTMGILLPPAGYFIRRRLDTKVVPLSLDFSGPLEVMIDAIKEETLEEWVTREHREAMKKRVNARIKVRSQPTPSPKHQQAKAKYITLREWGVSQFSVVPHANTLLRWVHEGRIQPQPRKIGRNWWVLPAAEYVSD